MVMEADTGAGGWYTVPPVVLRVERALAMLAAATSIRNRSAVRPDAAMRIVSKTLIEPPWLHAHRRTSASSAGKAVGNIGALHEVWGPGTTPLRGPGPGGHPRTAYTRPDATRDGSRDQPDPRRRRVLGSPRSDRAQGCGRRGVVERPRWRAP